jgi:hypothetical protein
VILLVAAPERINGGAAKTLPLSEILWTALRFFLT